MKYKQRNRIIFTIVKDAVDQKANKFRGYNCHLTIIDSLLVGGDKLIVIITYISLSHYPVDNRYDRDGSNSALRVG